MATIDVMISADAIAERLDALAEEVAAALPPEARNSPVLMIGPLKGAVMVMADLARALHRAGVDTVMDFIGLSSYGAGTVSKGTVTMTFDLSIEVAGRHVLLVDDIVDTGRTLQFAQAHIAARGPASLRTLVVLDKPERRVVEVPVEHVGFTIPDVFVIGYGTDLDQRYRELPFVGLFRPEG